MKKLGYILIMLCLPLCFQAQVHYTDIIPDTTIVADSGVYSLDLDNNGIADYLIQKNICDPLDTDYYHQYIISLTSNCYISYFLVEGCFIAKRYINNDTIPFSGSQFSINH